MPLSKILPLLPDALAKEIRARLASPMLAAVRPSEVRIRRGRIASLSLYRAGHLVNLPLRFCAEREDMRQTLARATGGSAYAYEEELKEGFFTVEGGVRVGVAGEVSTANGALTLTSVESLVFRLPVARASADALYSFYEAHTGGILLFAPPGGGKTTLLRAFAERAAQSRRVAVVDPRREFFFSSATLLLDVLSGYPKARGAEIAVRTLSPELLILDEVGAAEAEALCGLVSFGVPTVASVHGDRGDKLCAAPALRPLLSSGLFSYLWDVKEGRAIALSGEVSA